MCMYILLICAYGLVLGAAWGKMMRTTFFTDVFCRVTGRDHYERVRFRFYNRAVGQWVHVIMKSGKKYYGIMNETPDEEGDCNIILRNVSLDKGTSNQKLAAKCLLLNTDDVDMLELMTERTQIKGDNRKWKGTIQVTIKTR